MSDVNANIGVNIDSSQALAQLKALQRQISEFHNSISKSSEAAALAQKSLQKNLVASINSLGTFSAELRNVNTTAESFTKALENNKLSMREYFRYAGAATKTFGQNFKAEYDTIGKVAEERVKTLQTQYIKMGRDANGAMKAIAVRPLVLDMNDLSTKTQIAAQKQAIFNQLMRQGSTNLLNFGKNTQWAGRQLMVGFTLPLAAFGNTAAKAFQQLETEVIKFRKVYGDLGTSQSQTDEALKNIRSLADGYTKYGVEVSKTVGLASQAAAAGFQGADLMAQTDAASKLAVLGQIDQQQALETTISLQNAFKISSGDLASTIDFLNAVENQTVTSLDDITTAIPKVAPVIQSLGGDVKDLAFFMTAMKEGGVNAAEGANALKSGLASLINPSKKATEMLGSMGINITNIVTKNKGNLKATVIEFAKELDKLDPLARARAIETMFGKFQFARISTLLNNVIQTGNQASRVLDLTGQSASDLAGITTKELGVTSASALVKFQAAMAKLKASLAPVGEVFMKAFVPVLDFIGKILDKFNGLSDGTKKFIAITAGVIGGLGPILLMTFGLIANGIANIMKLFMTLRGGFQRLTGQSQNLGEQTQYLTSEQLDAAAAAHSLEQSHARLTQQFTAEAGEVNLLRIAYERALSAGSSFAMMNPGMMKAPKKFAVGGIFKGPGTGTSDSIPAMVSNGEAIIPAKTVNKYPGMVAGLISGKIPGFAKGKKSIGERAANVPIYGDMALFIQDRLENQSQGASVPGLANILAPLTARIGEARGLGFGQMAQNEYPNIIQQYTPIVNSFIDVLKSEMEKTKGSIASADERLSRAWQNAGKAVEESLSLAATDAERGAVKQALGISPDSYGSIAGNFRSTHGWGGRTARYEAGVTPASYMNSKYRSATSSVYQMMTGSPINKDTQDYGHAFSVKARQALGLPTTVALKDLQSGAAPISEATLSGITKSIQKAADKIEAAYDAASIKIKAAGQRVGKAATSGVAEGAQTASPSRATQQTAKDIIAGLTQTLAAGEPQVAIVGGKVGTIAVESVDSSVVKETAKRPGIFGRIFGKNKGIAAGAKSLKGMVSGRGMMAGAGMMAGSMALSALPEFTGKAMIQSSANMASMGSMFGGWGIAAGAALGLVTSGIGALIAKEKEHEAVAKATFQSTSEEVSLFGGKILDATLKLSNINISIDGIASKFGNLNPEVQKFVDMINSLPKDDPTKKFVEGLKTQKFTALVGNLRSKITSQIAEGSLAPEDAKKALMGYLTAAGRASEFANVWKNISLSVSNSTDATIASFNKLSQQAMPDLIVGQMGLSDSYKKTYTQLDGSLSKYKDLTPALRLVSDQMLNFAGVMTNGSLNINDFTSRLDGLKNSSLNSKIGIDALGVAIKNTGNPDNIAAFETIRATLNTISGEANTAANAILLMTINSMGASKEVDAWGKANAGRLGLNPMDLSSTSGGNQKVFQDWWNKVGKKRYTDFQKEQAKFMADLNGGGTGGGTVPGTGTDTLSKEAKLTIARLQKELDGLKTKRDVIKDTNDELKRQYDYQQKLMSLQQEAVQAKISGNYIGAAIIEQQKTQEMTNFKKETDSIALDKRITNLENRISGLQAGERVTAAEKALAKAKTKTYATGGLIKGPGTGTSDSISARFARGGLPTLSVSNGEYIVKAKSVQNYGLNFMNSVNNGSLPVSNNSAGQGNTVYNIDMTINGGNNNANEIADQVMRKIKTISSQNNKSNRVMI